jgi:hypothetical protein
MAAAPAIWGDLAVWQPLHLNRLIFSRRDSTQNGPPWYSTWASTLFRLGGVTESMIAPSSTGMVAALILAVTLSCPDSARHSLSQKNAARRTGNRKKVFDPNVIKSVARVQELL